MVKKVKQLNPFRRLSSRTRRLLLIGLVVIAGGVLALELTNKTHLFHDEPYTPLPLAVDQSTSAKNSTNTKAEPKGDNNPASSSSVNQGTAVDKQGQSTATTDATQWTTAESGALTVKQPVANSPLKSGDTLSGTTTAVVERVQFRLVDAQVGVVAQGFLNVVNGNFSGTISFSHHASTGRLDVFTTNSSGAETNEVQIKVNF